MNILSLLNHVHARTATPPNASRAQARSNASPGIGRAASSADASGASNGAASGGNSASITANDFLTLLVTEIQNQDPTSQTDPMTYITQLVGVNSLQQLVQMNQTLSTAVVSPTTPPTEQSQATRSLTAHSVTTSTAIQNPQPVTGARFGANAHQASPSASGPATVASTSAVAQALTGPLVMSQRIAPLTQVPLNPEAMRALEHSIPGAKLVGPPTGTQ